MKEKLEVLIRKYEQAVQAHFRWLHAHPELSGQEKETSAYVAAVLRDMGLEPMEGVGGYGVTALIRGKAPGRCLALRADMDALPLTEETDLPYKSQNPGVMHACGHDAHTAMLLGVAMVLTELKDAFRGCVKLIFQPSEENAADSGAKRMIADGVLENPRVDVLEQIKVPTQPVNSFSWKDAILDGMGKGLVLGLGLVALATALTRNVTSIRQLKAAANVPVLATFPQLAAKKRRTQKETMVTAESDEGFAEALRGLCLKLRKEKGSQASRVIVVTSTISGEGKTTTAVNLAQMLSEDGSSVVLVDADLRNQSIGRLLGVENGRGLLECLRSEKLDVLACLRRSEGSEVAVLSGSSAPDWKYTVDQKQLGRVLARLKERFDYVVLDTSPCAMVADTALLCRQGDSVLYVVRRDWARESQVLDNVSALHERDVTLTGFIFNGASRRGSGYGYGYGKYGYGKYGYGYGYGYGSRKK
mgnify:CR=1 FL=1